MASPCLQKESSSTAESSLCPGDLAASPEPPGSFGGCADRAAFPQAPHMPPAPEAMRDSPWSHMKEPWVAGLLGHPVCDLWSFPTPLPIRTSQYIKNMLPQQTLMSTVIFCS